FLVVERDAREQPVLVEKIVRDAQWRKEVMLLQRRELLRPLKQEIQLRRQGTAARLAIEALEERILVRVLEHEFRAEARGLLGRKARLADADRTFEDDETMCRRRPLRRRRLR